MKTTLLISTYNSPDYLRQCLISVQNQTVMPDEIVIADDGSDDSTRKLILQFKEQISVPIVHVWHEDKGFRKCMILNKAIARATGDYIIQVDGDVYLERHLIEDHLAIVRPGYWVNGSRVWLPKKQSIKLLANGNKFHKWQLPSSSLLNSFRCAWLRDYLKERYAIKKIDHMRGCNMAYWKEDAIRVNGYDEQLTQWGHEDGEFVFRLHFAGVRKQSLKMGGVVYHIYHKPSARDNEQAHIDVIERTKREHRIKCTNGIDKYLASKVE